MLVTIRAHYCRPDASAYGAQYGHGATAVSHHRSAGTVLSEGVLPQWVYQEPEAACPFLQYARCVPVPRPDGRLPNRNYGESKLLAYARGHGEHRHDARQSPSDGCGGEPTRHFPANAHGWLHQALPA